MILNLLSLIILDFNKIFSFDRRTILNIILDVKIFVWYDTFAVFHGVLRTLDPKPMRGAEPVVRVL